MRIAITDAHFLLDLYEIGYIHHLFNIKYEIVITLEVFNDLTIDQQKDMTQRQRCGQLYVVEILLSEHIKIWNIYNSPRLSFNDKSSLYLAKRDNLSVIIGDKYLKKYANELEIDTKDMTWFLDTLLQYRLISPTDADDKMQRLLP